MPGTDLDGKAHVCTELLKTFREHGVVVYAGSMSTGEDEAGGSSLVRSQSELQREF